MFNGLTEAWQCTQHQFGFVSMTKEEGNGWMRLFPTKVFPMVIVFRGK